MLADSQDNPGGGGPGDTTEILRALVSQGATDAVAGVINDAQAAESAHSAGIDAQINISLGGKSGFPGSKPFSAEFRVLGLSNGRFRATGEMLGGAEMDLGPTALLKVGGVRIVVGSKAIQTMDQSMFRHLGRGALPTKYHRHQKQHSFSQRLPANRYRDSASCRPGPGHRRPQQGVFQRPPTETTHRRERNLEDSLENI